VRGGDDGSLRATGSGNRTKSLTPSVVGGRLVSGRTCYSCHGSPSAAGVMTAHGTSKLNILSSNRALAAVMQNPLQREPYTNETVHPHPWVYVPLFRRSPGRVTHPRPLAAGECSQAPASPIDRFNI
jgi:hypothetical protein